MLIKHARTALLLNAILVFIFGIILGVILIFAGDSDVLEDYQRQLYRAAIHDTETQVYDGDTIEHVLIKIKDMDLERILHADDFGDVWPTILLSEDGLYTKIAVRLSGIDAPELHPKTAGRSKQSILNEKKAALNARQHVIDLLEANQNRFMVTNVSIGKYGRLVCDVFVGDVNVSKSLLENRLAVPYDGGAKTVLDWDSLSEGYVR